MQVKHIFREITNKRAHFEYTISDTYNAGMILSGDQVKQIAQNKFQLTGCYIKYLQNDWRKIVLITENYIIPLLLHKCEINKLIGITQQDGFTLIPLKIYQLRHKFKIEFGVAKGKKEYDKRADDKRVSIDNDLRRTIKSQKLGEY